MSAQIAKERVIKAALIDWLYSKGMVHDAVIINEMVVANWTRRADVVVANGHLYAFEIKSEVDTLKRLDGQVKSFSEHFDKVVVVAASKFISSILQEYPPEIGVLEASMNNGSLVFKQVRAGRISTIKSVKSLSSHLPKVELVKLLKQNGINADATARRASLELLLDDIPLKRARAFVLDSIKNKYRETFESFNASRLVHGSYQSLPELSRRNHILRAYYQAESHFKTEDLVQKSNAREMNILELEKKYGAFPSEMPRVVLNRKTSVRKNRHLPRQSQ